MPVNNFGIKGLSDKQVIEAKKKYGYNKLTSKKENGFIDAIKSLAHEPMVILLLVTSSIYFISGKTGDGIFLTAAIVLVATISLYQDSRSRNALEKLKFFTQPNCKVIRNAKVEEIKSENLVVGDSLIVEKVLLLQQMVLLFIPMILLLTNQYLPANPFQFIKIKQKKIKQFIWVQQLPVD